MTSEIARYVMIGGFLGAGKTTAIDRFARSMTDRGVRVGLITNDQSSGLVDTTILRSHGFAVEEITGGCFCCRFDSLQHAADELTRKSRPEVFLAEPVGSCTDLVATVSYPLRRIYGDRFRIAPLSVLVDPVRAARVLGLAEGRSFSPKVVYVYHKQLEEADIIVVNKIDELEEGMQKKLVGALEREFPGAAVVCVSRRGSIACWMATSKCVRRWLSTTTSMPRARLCSVGSTPPSKSRRMRLSTATRCSCDSPPRFGSESLLPTARLPTSR